MIFILVESNEGQFNRSHKALEGLGVKISSRQIRYFYKKVRLHERLSVDRKGKPANYRDLLRKL